MDCTRFETLLDAYADEVLPADDRRLVAEHLSCCARCRVIVSDMVRLRDAITRVWSEHQAPEGVRDRLLASLAEAGDTQLVSPSPALEGAASAFSLAKSETGIELAADEAIADAVGVEGPSAKRGPLFDRRTKRRLLRVVPIPLAAVVVYVLFLREHVPPPSVPTPAFTVVGVNDRVLVAAQRRHVWCATYRLYDHHAPGLPFDLASLGRALCDSLGLNVFAPDFSRHGFAFLGADRCRVAGVPAAHIEYYSAQKNMILSAFTVVRIVELGAEWPSDAHHRRYFSSSAAGVNAIAWHNGPQTHVICATLPPSTLAEMVEESLTRIALRDSRLATLANVK